MAQAKLWTRHSIIRVLMMGLLATFLASCRADDKPIGMTLLFQSAGRPVGVRRFDPDGLQGPTPGGVRGMAPRGGAEMAFMPGDGKHGVPKFVDVVWAVPTPESQQAVSKIEKPTGGVSKEQWDGYMAKLNEAYRLTPIYSRRIDLTSVVTPELITQVRADRQNTQLKLIITFNNEDVDIKAVAYKWR
ncbi:hypothetical protein [Collimonas antrihumi]|uniref:hypothetical protein n=1 Tax=Collimonas antrihumi TaxID=1940615 RepID=UPI001B8D2437|nr:hypothetical protein [Collimonas antrihumi]